MNNLVVVDHRVPSDYCRKKKNRFRVCLCMGVLHNARHCAQHGGVLRREIT